MLSAQFRLERSRNNEPAPHDPAVLEPLAEAIRESGLAEPSGLGSAT